MGQPKAKKIPKQNNGKDKQGISKIKVQYAQIHQKTKTKKNSRIISVIFATSLDATRKIV